jgi:hypothetical protein
MQEAMIRRALQALLDHMASWVYHLSVEMWNGSPVLNSAGGPILEDVGFYRDYPAMTWEKRL